VGEGVYQLCMTVVVRSTVTGPNSSHVLYTGQEFDFEDYTM